MSPKEHRSRLSQLTLSRLGRRHKRGKQLTKRHSYTASIPNSRETGLITQRYTACPQNLNLFSECFAAVAFYDIPANGSAPVNYTIWADAGLAFVFEERILRAIDQSSTGVQVPTPLVCPSSQETNEEQATSMRLSYIKGIRELLVIAL
ncbi:hypothetical protein K443DRAFT_6276 [Laccaria amethystina LaAM-08-1]|uniref:Uncharacterized protein n=1 Tax=Laccaria amethystina LaAM-08-1 TaxID=1095629 RepID=A0A0C9XL08_9AGAR|nr:hypothetical protein K443DRAFT_6276 [Laccaria amethystina LaAM-08-1]